MPEAMSPKENIGAAEIQQQSKQKLLFPPKIFHLPVPFQNQSGYTTLLE